LGEKGGGRERGKKKKALLRLGIRRRETGKEEGAYPIFHIGRIHPSFAKGQDSAMSRLCEWEEKERREGKGGSIVLSFILYLMTAKGAKGKKWRRGRKGGKKTI